MKTTYKEMEQLIKSREPFRGSSVSSDVRISLLNTDIRPYTVYSYDTAVCIVYGDRCILNITKYSRTTSKIQNILRKMFPAATFVDNLPEGIFTFELLVEKLTED